MKINKNFLFNYIKTLVVSTIAVVLIMKYILNKDIMSFDRIVIFLAILSVLIFLGHLIVQKRREIMKKNR